MNILLTIYIVSAGIVAIFFIYLADMLCKLSIPFQKTGFVLVGAGIALVPLLNTLMAAHILLDWYSCMVRFGK